MAKKNKRLFGGVFSGQSAPYASKPFYPHSFRTEMKVSNDSPRIMLTQRAYSTMASYVDICDEEISWLGVVDRKDMLFIIDEIFLFDQHVSGTHTTMSIESQGKFFSELIAQPGGAEKANKIRFWGHSHVRMDTFASGQDENQLAEHARLAEDYFIRGIFNKLGKAQFTIMIQMAGGMGSVIYTDVPWTMAYMVDRSERERIEAEVEQKVTSRMRHFDAPHVPRFGAGADLLSSPSFNSRRGWPDSGFHPIREVDDEDRNEDLDSREGDEVEEAVIVTTPVLAQPVADPGTRIEETEVQSPPAEVAVSAPSAQEQNSGPVVTKVIIRAEMGG